MITSVTPAYKKLFTQNNRHKNTIIVTQSHTLTISIELPSYIYMYTFQRVHLHTVTLYMFHVLADVKSL